MRELGFSYLVPLIDSRFSVPYKPNIKDRSTNVAYANIIIIIINL